MERKVLNRLYDTTRELETSAEYENLTKDFAEVKEKFLEKVGKENRIELEQVTDTLQEMDNDLSKQAFCEGFSMAVRLFVESTYKE